MILRIILKNFLSFDDEMQFDMFPNMKRTSLPGHITMAAGKLPVLKMAAIYGPNGAGKSNIVKAIEFVRNFAVHKYFIRSLELENYFFLLKEDAAKEPICLAVEFETQGKFLLYEIEISTKYIAKECLYETFPLENRIELIFERKKQNVTFPSGTSVDDAIAEATKKMLEKTQCLRCWL